MDERSITGKDEPLGELARRLVDDVNLLARDHVDLARVELGRGLKKAASEAAGAILGGVVAVIGLAMLCATLVVALAPVIAPLWARMLLCSVLFLAVGGTVTGVLLRKLKTDATPAGALPHSRHEARTTTHLLKEQVHHG